MKPLYTDKSGALKGTKKHKYIADMLNHNLS